MVTYGEILLIDTEQIGIYIPYMQPMEGISIVTRNPQVSQDHADPQLHCGSEWSSPILTRNVIAGQNVQAHSDLQF